MSTALVVFVLVLLLPLFLASWRVSLVGLASQGAIMAWLAYDRDGVTTVADGVRLVDLGLVRAAIVPALLYRVMAARRADARNDVIAPNLVSWALALTAVLVGFRFAAHMPLPDAERPFVAAAAAALLLAMLVLASSERVFSQVVGVFRFENALALFELSRPERAVKVRALELGVTAGGRVLLFISGAASLVLAVLAFRHFGEGYAVLLLAIWIAVGFIFRGVAHTVSAISDPALPGRGWEIFFGIISLIAWAIDHGLAWLERKLFPHQVK